MAKSEPEKQAIGPGLHFITPTPAACMVFSSVVQGALDSIANDLAARADLDKPTRIAFFDRFVGLLVREAKNATLDNVSPKKRRKLKSLSAS